LGRHVEVTFKEEMMLKTLLDKIKKGYKKPIDATATELRIARHTVYTTLHRLRRRYGASLQFGDQYRRWRKRIGDKYL